MFTPYGSKTNTMVKQPSFVFLEKIAKRQT